MKQRLLPFLLVIVCCVVGCHRDLVVPQKIQKINDSKPPEPRFDRLYENKDIVRFMKEYVKAYPQWVELESLGKSTHQNDIWLLTLNNPKTGKASEKPAMYIDGSIHANEAQCSEMCLYIVDYLLKNYGKLQKVTELMDRVSFYLVPIVSPDSRKLWFDEPSTPHFPRTVLVSRDDDQDGAVDEDGFDDIDQDGVITSMRKKVPLGQGTHRLHDKDKRLLVRIKPGEQGDYLFFYSEGFDNDGDGLINEDNRGYIDPNRTWGYFWQPRHIQYGTSDYPLQIPETRHIANWLMGQENIAACQSFHNAGGMILRGPGAKTHGEYPSGDVQTYDYLGKEGIKMLPNYRYMVIHQDLYTVYGGTINHFYGVHGILSFTNELNSIGTNYHGHEHESSHEKKMRHNDLLAKGRMFVEWKKFKHPQLGDIEVGGYKHDVGRIPEPWRMQEDYHRNAAFVLFHASHLPKISFAEPQITSLGDDVYKVILTVNNDKAIPTVSEMAIKNKCHRKDIATIEGAKILSSGVVTNLYHNKINVQEHRPERLMVPGVQGFKAQLLYFLVKAKKGQKVKVTYDSLKGGVITQSFDLID